MATLTLAGTVIVWVRFPLPTISVKDQPAVALSQIAELETKQLRPDQSAAEQARPEWPGRAGLCRYRHSEHGADCWPRSVSAVS